MAFLIGFLTLVMVLDCVIVILLVLIQLPKKDAGAGLAFGGGAADALFGAGSGNALTKITKYASVVFFVLALSIGILQDRAHQQGNTSAFEKQVQQMQTQVPAAAPATLPPTAPKNDLLIAKPVADNNAPAAPAAPAPAK